MKEKKHVVQKHVARKLRLVEPGSRPLRLTVLFLFFQNFIKQPVAYKAA